MTLETYDGGQLAHELPPRELAQKRAEQVEAWRKLVQQELKEGHDYGYIPGVRSLKPSLFQPGAEKILVLAGARAKYEVMDKNRKPKKGPVYFEMRCQAVTVMSPDIVLSEGVGECNSKERGFQKRDGTWLDPYDIMNNVMKKAKKRALVDCAKMIGSVSDIFTQDLEDMNVAHVAEEQNQRRSPKSKPAPPVVIENVIAWLEGAVEKSVNGLCPLHKAMFNKNGNHQAIVGDDLVECRLEQGLAMLSRAFQDAMRYYHPNDWREGVDMALKGGPWAEAADIHEKAKFALHVAKTGRMDMPADDEPDEPDVADDMDPAEIETIDED